MNEYRYILASNKVSKLNCPYCGAKKHWQRYVDIETGEVLPEQHGRCDNESKCGQWVTPKETGYAKMRWEQEQGKHVELPGRQIPKRKDVKIWIIPETVCFDFETFRHTLEPERYKNNFFIQNLLSRVPFPFDADDVTRVIELYRLGTITNGYRAGANTFPFIDIKGKVRAIQVKKFDEKNHTTGTDFLHSIIEKHCARNNSPLPEWLDVYKKQEKLVSCLFGEHLLSKYPSNPVALAEAPKSAIYGTLYFGAPKKSNDLLWLAVYNLSSLTRDKCEVLKGRKVILFPDLSKEGKAYNMWEQKAREFQGIIPGSKFVVSDLLEKNASTVDRGKGLDIADYLIRFDWRAFRPITTKTMTSVVSDNPSAGEDETKHAEPNELPQSNPDVFNLHTGECLPYLGKKKSKTEIWPIDELVAFFETATLPGFPVRLDAGTEIIDIKKFITGQVAVVRANNGNPSFRPYYDRLLSLKKEVSAKDAKGFITTPPPSRRF